jgi:proteasome accessory factor A
MNEVTTLLKVGSADIVLRMIEAGVAMRDLSWRTRSGPSARSRTTSPAGRRCRLASGKEVSALEIQQEYFDKATEFLERRGRRRGDRSGSSTCGVGCSAPSRPEASTTVDREIDWVTKLRVIEGYQRRHDLSLSHPRIAQMDLAYHDLRRGRGLYGLLERRGTVDRVATDLEIFEAKETPPQTTRARLRGEFIRHAQERRRDFTVDWVHLKLNDQAQRTVLCKDPFRAYDERVDRLIASM